MDDQYARVGEVLIISLKTPGIMLFRQLKTL